jgi:hypothetical protein
MALPEFNGFKHPFTGRATVMTEDDRKEHILCIREFVKSLDPRDYLEIQLTRTLAIDHWRLNRIKAVEENLFTFESFATAARTDNPHPQVHHAMSQALAFASQAKVVNTLSLYEQRLTRIIHQNLNLLLKLQARRQKQESQPRAQAESEIEPKPLTRTATASSAEAAETPETPQIEFPDAA